MERVLDPTGADAVCCWNCGRLDCIWDLRVNGRILTRCGLHGCGGGCGGAAIELFVKKKSYWSA